MRLWIKRVVRAVGHSRDRRLRQLMDGRISTDHRDTRARVVAAWLAVVLVTTCNSLKAADPVKAEAGTLQSAQFWFSSRMPRVGSGEQWILVAEIESGGLRNLVVEAAAASGEAAVTNRVGSLKAGHEFVELPLAPSTRVTTWNVRLAWSGGERTYSNVDLTPPRKWTLYLSQHTHTDIGYTRAQTEILPESLRFIDYALDFCDATDSLPDDARFRWTCETFWAVREFLTSRPPEQIERLKRRVAEGRIEVTGLMLNLSEIATEDSLTASLQPLRMIREVLGAPVRLAMQNDVNGAAWCLPDLFEGMGVRYLTMGINQTRSILPFDKPTPFWWESPSGTRLLAYRAEHYMLANFWNLHTGDRAKFIREMPAYLRSLENRSYAFDRAAVQFSGYFTDNSPPSIVASEFVRRWNEDHAWPRLRLSTAGEFPAWVAQEHRDRLPVHRQAWPDWWTDGFGSAARETAASRETHSVQRANEALLAMASLLGRTVPEGMRRRADAVQENLMFYDEHTYGAAESISDPSAENSQVQWGEKSAYAWTAVKEAALLREQAWGLLQEFLPRGEHPAIAVVNTLSWTRSGPVKLFIDHELLPPDRAFRIVDVAAGTEVPVQSLNQRSEGTYWVLWVTDVPPMGYRMLRLEPSAGPRPEPAQAEAKSDLESAHFALRLDPGRGGIGKLVDKSLDLAMVEEEGPAFGQLIYETLTEGRDLLMDRFRRAPWVDVKVEPGVSGPLWKSAVLTGRLGGCATNPPARLEVRLWETDKRVELLYGIRKLPVTTAESVYVALPFRAPGGTLAYEAQGGLVIPGRDQLPGSASDWQTIQNYLSVRHGTGQFVWVSEQVPLVQLGGINLGRWQRQTRVDQPHVYSWIMNNYWFTNFRVSQEGEFRWTYDLTSITDTTPGAAARFGWATRVPLAARVLAPLPGAPSGAPAARSILAVDAPGVLVVAARAVGPDAVWLHLREVNGQRVVLDESNVRAWRPIRQADEVNVLGEELTRGIDSLALEPYGVKFVRLEIGREP